jgi:hypothetical protein
MTMIRFALQYPDGRWVKYGDDANPFPVYEITDGNLFVTAYFADILRRRDSIDAKIVELTISTKEVG